MSRNRNRNLRYWLHEWNMRRRIRAILRYNRKHPEQCINLQDHMQPNGSGIVSREVIEEAMRMMFEHGEIL